MSSQMHRRNRSQNRKNDTPPNPLMREEISTNKSKGAGKKYKVRTKICQENSKTSYHLTGNPLKCRPEKSFRAGKMKKSILPELTCSYLKMILPEINIILPDYIINYQLVISFQVRW